MLRIAWYGKKIDRKICHFFAYRGSQLVAGGIVLAEKDLPSNKFD